MGLDLWFVEDIRNALLAAYEANEAMMEEVIATTDKEVIREMAIFSRGYKAALATMALAFGIPPQALGIKSEGQ